LPRLLMLNWRDLWHPAAGGAEVITFRVLERLVQRGWDVEWFSAAYANGSADEVRDGISYVRRGSQVTTHLEAYRHYRGTAGFDVVVDQINTLPFFAPLYFSCPAVAFFMQLAQGVWQYELGPVIGGAGSVLEHLYLRPYRYTPLITISKSSGQSLRAIGLRGPMHIIEMAVDEEPDPTIPEKSLLRDVVVVARLTPSKRIEHAIMAASIMAQRGWRGRLFIIGSGSKADYVASLRRLADRLLPDRCEFVTSVKVGTTGNARTTLLRSCSVTWLTPGREGRVLVITEANCHGTPAVVYRVPGVVDSVKEGVTGLIAEPTPESLAAKTLELFKGDYGRFAQNALADAQQRSWDTTADGFERALYDYAPALEG